MKSISATFSENEKSVILEKLNAMVLKDLKPVSLVLALLYLFFAISHYIFLRGQLQLILTLTAAVTVFLLLLINLALQKFDIPAGSAHPLGLLIALIVLLNGILHLYLADDPLHTTNLALILLGCGFLFLSTTIYLVVVFITSVSWLFVAIVSTNRGTWLHFGFFLISSMVLSTIIHIVHKRARTEAEKIRLSEQKQTEELKRVIVALKESREKYRDLLENANDLIQSVNADGKFEYVNKAWEDLLGYTAADREKLTFIDIIREDNRQKCAEIYEQVSRGESFQNQETVFVSKSGREIFVEGSISPQMNDDRFIATRAIFRDITQRKQAEEELHRLHKELKSVNERLKEAYVDIKSEKDILSKVIQDEEIAFLIDSTGIISAVTNKASQLTGKSRLEILNQPLAAMFGDDSKNAVTEAIRLANIKNFHSVDAFLKAEQPTDFNYVVNIMRLNGLKEKQLLVILRIDTNL
ncbi:MAG: PAS domain-containing protein [Fidelibacterota bacterium]